MHYVLNLYDAFDGIIKLKVRFILNRCASSKSHIFLSHFPFWCCQDPIETTKSNQAFHQTFFCASTKLVTVIITMMNVKGGWDFHSQEPTLTPNRTDHHPHTHLWKFVSWLYFSLFFYPCLDSKVTSTIHKATYWLTKPVDLHCLSGNIIS